MRILFLINYYQIHGFGGEDLSCRQVIGGLRERCHTTLVLTSMHGTNNVSLEEDGVYRSLYLEMDLAPWRHSITFFTRRKAREKHNLQVFERVVEQFKPDIIFIWGIWNLPRSLPVFAEARYPNKVVYRLATYWPTLPNQHEVYWRKTGRTWYSQLLKRILSPVALAMLAKEEQQPPLTFKHAICVSAATRNILVQAGIPIENARVIHTGLDAQHYLERQTDQQPSHKNQDLNLLYAGRIWPEKGVDTAIHALERLVFGRDLRTIKLTVVGSGSPDYEKFLHDLVDQAGLNDYVSFSSYVPAEEMPQLLQKFDVLLVPSIWQEPFSRIVLEGMISGLVVIATTTGGTTEILIDGENGLLFAPGDAEDLTQKIVSLVVDPEVRRRLATVAQKRVLEGFTMTKMMDNIEGYLQEVSEPSIQKKIGEFERQEDSILKSPPTVSVIIPTYNRKDSLRETLISLAQQTYPSDRFEVIIVDDGSTDETKEILSESFPFTLRYFWQSNQGASAARNLGAAQSQADILVLLDDDILVEPDYLAYLIHDQAMCQNRIVVGAVTIRPDETTPLSQTLDLSLLASKQSSTELVFTDVYSNNMALFREAYFELGMMQDLSFLGASRWCDVDLGYRAYGQGFDFRRSTKARCWHRDHLARNLDGYKKHMRTTASQAVILFQKYPGLRTHLPMFDDKTPIIWHEDSPLLIARKFARSMVSSRLVLWSMEQIVNALEKSYPASTILPSLYRYIIGGYIFQGYREGLGKFESARAQE